MYCGHSSPCTAICPQARIACVHHVPRQCLCFFSWLHGESQTRYLPGPDKRAITTYQNYKQQTQYGLCPPSQKRGLHRGQTRDNNDMSNFKFQVANTKLCGVTPLCRCHQRNRSRVGGRDTLNLGISHVATSQDRDERNVRLAKQNIQ